MRHINKKEKKNKDKNFVAVKKKLVRQLQENDPDHFKN